MRTQGIQVGPEVGLGATRGVGRGAGVGAILGVGPGAIHGMRVGRGHGAGVRRFIPPTPRRSMRLTHRPSRVVIQMTLTVGTILVTFHPRLHTLGVTQTTHIVAFIPRLKL
jgi:hypothetical protein